jgi:hypothetical protein
MKNERKRYNLHGYLLVGVKDSGIYVLEDEDNWLHIKDDPAKYFSIEDIEEELDIQLTHFDSHINFKPTKH